MGFSEAVKAGFSNYVTFSGRAQRSAFWYWTLFLVIGGFVTGFIDGLVFGAVDLEGNGPVNLLWSLATLLPSLAVAVRRLHDLDRSGWWYLLVLLPIIGWIILIFFFVQPGTTGPNRFGKDPLDPGASPHQAPDAQDDTAYARSNIPRIDRTD